MDLLTGVPLIELARAAGEQAGNACLDKAQRVADFDSAGASAFILRRLQAMGPQSGESLTNAAKAAGFVAHDDRAFGPVFGSLSRRGQIRCVGYCDRAKGHGTAGGRVWEAA